MLSLAISKFSWHKSTKTLAVEISSLGISSLPQVLRVYNHKTGGSKTFRAVETMARHGEILGWRYQCTTENLCLTIYND